MTSIATQGNICGACHQQIEVGDQIVRSIANGVAHVSCDAYGVGESW